MSTLDTVLRWLGLVNPQAAVVLDTIGQPVAGVDVQIANPAGTVLSTVHTGADGGFSFAAGVTCPTVYDLIVDPDHLAARFRLTNPIGPLHVFVVRVPVTLTGSVGVDGANAPLDLLRLQDHLRHVGRLTDADVTAEPISATATVAIPAADVPRLMTALCAQLRAGTGTVLMHVDPGSPELAAINAASPLPPLPAAPGLAAPVGDVPGRSAPALARNHPADVRFVQDRLQQLGYLSPANYAADLVDPSTAADPVPEASLAQTIASIKQFNRQVVGSWQHAIFSGQPEEARLRDPFVWGTLPLVLSASVGADGVNRPADVRALQDRLHETGPLSDTDYGNEKVTPPAPGAPAPPVDPATLSHTIDAIRTVHAPLLPPGAPAVSTLALDDDAVRALSRPPAVEIFRVGDERPPVSRPADTSRMNHPRHVRAVQDRLRLLGFLSDVAWATERVNPSTLEAVQSANITGTLAAIRAAEHDLGIPAPGQLPGAGGESLVAAQRPTAITLQAAVGDGQPNHSADVRAVQDRLHQLHFLSDADYTAEQVSPTAPAPGALPATFAAMSQLRRTIFGLPAASADPWTARPVIEPTDDTLRFMNDPFFWGYQPLRLTGSVGTLGRNRAEDVRAVQQRLRTYRLLSAANLTAETPATGRHDRVRDAELAHTIQAIRTLRHDFLGLNPEPARIEAVHPALLALDRPFERLRLRLGLTGSVGTGGDNAVSDVVAVQRRLRDLRRLDSADYATEAPLVAAPVDFTHLPRTLAAIDGWRTLNDGPAPAHTYLDDFDASARRLDWPLLPIPSDLALAHDVGAGAAGAHRNRQADVLLVQDRLHQLGVFATGDYLGERRIAAGLATIAGAQMPHTIAAIHAFQHTASGGTDSVVSAGGNSERVLRDPTFGTPVPTNPSTPDRDAGPAMPAHYHADPARNREIIAIIAAIEANEAGGSTGEVPAVLHSGSPTPASFGKGQLIAQTAIGTLQNNAPTAGFYDLTAANLTALDNLLGQADAEYGRIFALVPAPGMTEAQLQAAITADQTANGANFRAQTGLGPDDQALMFRTAQFRRQTRHFIDGQAGANDAAKRANAVTHVGNFVALADVAANMTLLHMHTSDARAFLRRAIDNEHKAGFLMRVAFYAEQGLVLKAALTDDSGFKLGRFLIRDNFVHVLTGPGGAAFTREQRAQLTAYLHNHGHTTNVATAAADSYVQHVMAHWVDPGP